MEGRFVITPSGREVFEPLDSPGVECQACGLWQPALDEGDYPLARCVECGHEVGIVYDPREGEPEVRCNHCA